jgi:general secretion pathway protein D
VHARGRAHVIKHVRPALFLFLASFALLLQGQDAVSLAWEAERLEESGDHARAWLLWSQAAQYSPGNARYKTKVSSLRERALAEARVVMPAAASGPAQDNEFYRPLTETELIEEKRLLPPPVLTPREGTRSFRLQATKANLWRRVMQSWGLDVVFDSGYRESDPVQISVDSVTFEESLRGVEHITNSFAVPLGEKLLLIVEDTQQKRQEQEPSVAVSYPLPWSLKNEEATEVARGVQTMMDLQKVVVDSRRGVVLLRGAWSKVRPAWTLFQQMARQRAEVSLEVELLEWNESRNSTIGIGLPNVFQIINRFAQQPLRQLLRISTNHFATAIGDTQLFASYTHNNASSLYRTDLRSLDGLPANIHIGDRFPILSASFSAGSFQVPQVTFEDLGLTLKITPRTHGGGDVTLEMESEFKLLTGETNNGVPVISNRRFLSTVRLKNNEWAIVGGLVTSTEARSITGIPGLVHVPGLNQVLAQRQRDNTDTRTLLVIRPRRTSLHPSEFANASVYTGSESRGILLR